MFAVPHKMCVIYLLPEQILQIFTMTYETEQIFKSHGTLELKVRITS
jgi:hypothetical protein